MLPTKEFNEEFKRHVKICKRAIEDGQVKELVPRVILVCAGNAPSERTVAIVGLDGMPDTNEEKRAAFGKLGLAAAANDLKVLMAIFQSEAWTVHCKEGEWEKMPRPSEHPERIEVVVNVARSLDDRNAMATIPITGRDADGALILGEPDLQIEEDEGEERSVKDSLLSSFFLTFMTGTAVKYAIEQAKESGKDVPDEAKQLLAIMDSCPIKFQTLENLEEMVKKAQEQDRKLDDDFLRRFKR
jgi:hypothetical protein